MTARDLLLAELRIAHMRAKIAQNEIEFLGQALRGEILTEAEVLEALEQSVGWQGFLQPELMQKIRKACGADVG
ncbi:MAG TPA: hypothetical protein VFO41_04060 [Alphaproteobacteria bacterium]|nr:hypothetical protein [Alphaproteobacteria bacterium]